MPINFLTAHDRVWLSCSQLWSLTSLTEQSARGGSQRTHEVSWTQEGWVWGQGRSHLATHRLTAADLWHLPCFTTARLSLRSCCTQMSLSPLTADLSQMPAALIPSQQFHVSLPQFFSLSVTVWCSWSIITGTNWVIYSTTSVCSAEYRKHCTKGRGRRVSLLTFQSHVKTSEESREQKQQQTPQGASWGSKT